MLFSSLVFLFCFLPITLFVCLVLFRSNRTLQNFFLCAASLFFYAWGEPRFVLVMMLSIAVNWMFGLLVDRSRDSGVCRLYLFFDVLFNLILIFIFKYLRFVTVCLNQFTPLELEVPNITLPIGISFFTFQAISYVVDVYRQKGEAQKNIFNVALYISLFPQLIAGPIVRYETVAYEIHHRKFSMDDFTDGVCRFIVGLGKKVLIANSMAQVADCAYNIAGSGVWLGAETPLTMPMAWLGAIAYSFQILFDFSGYSDMAIGLGKMLGFHFLENFDRPYCSSSVTEFWRRWHISLGSWFRDYVYFPLGGSRVSHARHIFNLFVVWLCTGIWHGANFTFIVWGLLYFVILVFEKYTGLDRPAENPVLSVLKHAATLFVVMLGWVIFRSDSIGAAITYIGRMFTLSGTKTSLDAAVFYFREYWVWFAAAAILSSPIPAIIKEKMNDSAPAQCLRAVFLLSVFFFTVSFIVKGSYNPFIYFNF